MVALKDRWKAFGTTFLDPWIILLFLCTVALAIVLVSQDDVTMVTTLTFLVSLFSGVLGGIVAKRWDDLTEEKIIVTRAKSANRSLQLLLSNVIALERRVRLYLQRHGTPEPETRITSEVIKTYLEEIVEDCLGIEENVIKSIEDWTDIDPMLEVKTVINHIRELNAARENAELRLGKVNHALQERNDKSEAELDQLRETEEEIKELVIKIEKELREKSVQMGVPIIGDSLITGSHTPSTFPSAASAMDVGIATSWIKNERGGIEPVGLSTASEQSKVDHTKSARKSARRTKNK